MALLEMKKIRVITYGKESSKLLEVIQKLGTVEFIDVSDSYVKYNLKKRQKTVFEFNYVSGRLDFAVDFLSKFQKTNFLRKALEDGREAVSAQEVGEIAKSFYFNDLVDSVTGIETSISEAKQRIQKLTEEEEILSDWAPLPFSLGIDLHTKTTESIFIKARGKKEDLSSVLNEKEYVFNLLPVGEENFTLTFFKTDKENILKILSETGAEIVELPKRRGNPQEELERITRAKKKAEKEIIEAHQEAKKISDEHLSKIKILSDYFYWKRQKDDALTSAIGTDNVSVFEGWCPSKKTAELSQELSKLTNLFSIEELTPEENEVPPVEIENNRFFKPFEAITRLYGMPGHKDLDPTVFLSGFFFIFFGLCLTDVVYGLFILTIFSLILFFYKVPKEIKPLFKLLMLGGLASVLVGFFFGGYAGIDIKFFPEWMQKIQFFDPIASPLAVFYLSLIMGVLQVMAGIAIKILAEAKNNNLKGGLLDNVPWLLFFFSMILFIGAKFGVWASSPYFNLFIYASLAALVLTQGRKEKSVFRKGLMGVLSLYGSVGYFSDILSYSRLLALGLATSALAFSINLIAVLARDMVPYVGLILMVIILIIGHLFNLVINILGAFIHSARLQFVEFFGKFLSGSGRNFKPFRQEERNVVIIK